MKKVKNLVKNPITWIATAIVCLVGVIVWAVTGRPNFIEDLKD